MKTEGAEHSMLPRRPPCGQVVTYRRRRWRETL